ncbi:hypothetical protein Cfor_09877 [Coptotermes formosanus]|uniref:Uncharacterized protein n=1 Tax=Coptotermes formosanus TaxID=36987 RepID=A0A6L2PKU0_COPFO|nr:hypothetical protein Cfor_09877 [Coptotermes formosanus]
MVRFPPANEDCKQRSAVSVDGVCTDSPVKLAGVHEKGEYCNTSVTDIKVPKMGLEKNKSSRSRKSVLGTEDVLSPKRCKTVGFTCGGSLFTKGCASLKQNGYINHERRNSADVIRAKKQFGLTHECVVKLERLSPEVLIKLSQKKEHRRPGTKSVTEMRHRYKSGKYSYFQKSSGKCHGTKEETQGSVRFQEGGMFVEQNYDNTWGDIRLDSWGNVRYLGKEHGDFSESEEDWHGWGVHIVSLHNLPNAQLYSISDGVKESRTVIWDSAVEPVTTTQNKGIQVPEQTDYVCDEKLCNKEGCAGINFDV